MQILEGKFWHIDKPLILSPLIRKCQKTGFVFCKNASLQINACSQRSINVIKITLTIVLLTIKFRF